MIKEHKHSSISIEAYLEWLRESLYEELEDDEIEIEEDTCDCKE
tara:strand:- start:273 stop:404 length:132 start_codon:yes stop_codon:yes gene_type:complete